MIPFISFITDDTRSLYSALFRTNEAPDVANLEKMIKNQHTQTRQDDVTKYSNDLIKFFVRYAWQSIPSKDHVKEMLQGTVEARLDEILDDVDEDNEVSVNDNDLLDHCTIVEMVTPSDVAYAMWQLVNSYEDWDAKIELVGEGSNVDRYKCQSRWTADRKLPAMEDRNQDDPGMLFYNGCLKWAKEFKSLFNKNFLPLSVKNFRIKLNQKSIELGYYKMPSRHRSSNSATNNKCRRVKEKAQEEMDVPLFDEDDYEKVMVVVGV
ncbi:MAG: hypothetical protein ACO3P6_04940 [Pelagibacteraceae bacterium]